MFFHNFCRINQLNDPLWKRLRSTDQRKWRQKKTCWLATGKKKKARREERQVAENKRQKVQQNGYRMKKETIEKDRNNKRRWRWKCCTDDWLKKPGGLGNDLNLTTKFYHVIRLQHLSGWSGRKGRRKGWGQNFSRTWAKTDWIYEEQ